MSILQSSCPIESLTKRCGQPRTRLEGANNGNFEDEVKARARLRSGATEHDLVTENEAQLYIPRGKFRPVYTKV